MLDAVSSSSGYSASCSLANWSTNSTVSSSKMSSLSTNMPSSLDDWVSAWRRSRSSITWESWLTHSMGSVWRVSLSSTITPPTKIRMLPTMRTGAIFVGRLPSHTTRRPSTPVRKSLPVVGDLYSRMPRAASGPTMLTRQIIAMPTASSRPKSRIIGTLANRRARKAKMASKVTTSSAGPRARADSWIGCTSESITTSSSMRACIWIA